MTLAVISTPFCDFLFSASATTIAASDIESRLRIAMACRMGMGRLRYFFDLSMGPKSVSAKTSGADFAISSLTAFLPSSVTSALRDLARATNREFMNSTYASAFLKFGKGAKVCARMKSSFGASNSAAGAAFAPAMIDATRGNDSVAVVRISRREYMVPPSKSLCNLYGNCVIVSMPDFRGGV